MSDPGRQLADAFHLLRVTKLALQRSLLRDVFLDCEKMRDLTFWIRHRSNRL